MLGITSSAEDLLGSHEGPCSIELDTIILVVTLVRIISNGSPCVI
jgi:hypothetical protein